MKLVTATIKIDNYPPGNKVLISENFFERLVDKGKIDTAIATVPDDDQDSINAVKSACEQALYESQAPEREAARQEREYRAFPDRRPKRERRDMSGFTPTLIYIDVEETPLEEERPKRGRRSRKPTEETVEVGVEE